MFLLYYSKFHHEVAKDRVGRVYGCSAGRGGLRSTLRRIAQLYGGQGRASGVAKVLVDAFSGPGQLIPF